MAAKFEIDHEGCRLVSNPTGSSSESIVTQILNVGIEVFSVAMSFLSCGTLHIHSEFPGGENIGRTSFCTAIASIFSHHDVSDAFAADGTAPSTPGGSPSPRTEFSTTHVRPAFSWAKNEPTVPEVPGG